MLLFVVLAFLASVQQRKALKTQPRCAQPLFNGPIAHTTPTGNISETPELGTPLYNGQNVGSQWWPLLRGFTVLGKSFDAMLSRIGLKWLRHLIKYS